MINRNVVHAFQRSQRFGTQILIKYGPSGSFIHETVRGHGNDQYVALLLRGLQMAYMARVDQEPFVSFQEARNRVADLSGFEQV